MNLYKLLNNFIFKYISVLGIGFILLCGSCFLAVSGDLKSNYNYSDNSVSVIEIVGQVNKTVLFKICKEHNLPPSSVYQWHDHVAIYKRMPLPNQLVDELKKQLRSCEIKTYETPFYNFNRQQHCGDKPAKEWDNILLTANLVADPKLQAEYLSYHATQFKKWPEVSQGFCNASFQQLLVFKSGRQLMLIISIPKGESLDKLNPLTTKNNPRVDDWNNIMKKYQEGIAGTKKDEVWVFLKPIN